MIRTIVTALALLIGVGTAQACLGPQNVFGIQFSDGESVDVNMIEYLGEPDVSYIKNVDDGITSYKFRSHYNPAIMVEVLLTGSPSAYNLNTLTFTMDFASLTLSDEQYGECIKEELDWLVMAGIIDMDRVVREKIEADFKAKKAVGFYWTKEDTLVNNEVVILEDGTMVATACSGDELAAVVLPPQQIEIITKTIRQNRSPNHSNRLAGSVGKAVLLDINGRLISGKSGTSAHRGCGVGFYYDRANGKVAKTVIMR